MATQITNYQCPACTGPLHFSEASGKLQCDYCGSSYTIEEVEAFFAEQNQKAEEAFQKEQEAEVTASGQAEELGRESDPKESGTVWDNSGFTDDWGKDAENMRAYNCPSCGAELICDVTTAATSCPYCGNPSIVPGQFGGTLKPELILPFKLDKKAAKEALKNHYKGKFFLPNAFRSENHLEELKGIYVPFWLYDATTTADCEFDGLRVHTFTDGEYEITETEQFLVKRGGSMEFHNIPADGSKKMDDSYMDSIEPFDYRELKPFSTAYLPGFFADRFDVTAEENRERVDRRCRNSAISVMRNDVFGYGSVIERRCEVAIKQGKVRYALLPVWTLRTQWNGKSYMFMMNGQTGKFVGDLPVSGKKYWSCFWGITAVLTLLLSFLFSDAWPLTVFRLIFS